MKILNFILSYVFIAGILSGCANITTAANKSPSMIATSNPEATPTETPPDITQADKDDLPSVELTEEILFKVIIAEIAFQRGDFSTAYATTMAVAQQTHDPRLAKRGMEMALLAKQPLQAFIAARLWHEYAPHSDEATQYYVGFMLLNNNWDEVKSTIAERLAAAKPKDRGMLILQTQRLLMRSNNKETAFNTLLDLYKPYPNYFESHLALAQAAYVNNNGVRALTEANTALRLNPTSQLAALTLAQVSPSPSAALKSLTDFLAKNPSAEEVRRAYAGILVEQKQYAQARRQFEVLNTNKPHDPATLFALGVLSLQLNDVVDAEKELKESVRIIENTPNAQQDPTTAYLYLSQIADDRKDGVSALAWLSKIQPYNDKNANYFKAQLRRAGLIARYQSLENAQQFLRTIKVNPAFPDEPIKIIQLEAELLQNAKHNEEAHALLQKAMQKYPDNPDLLFDFGMMAEKLNRWEEMETAFRRVIQLNPEHQLAYNALGYSLADRNIRLDEARTLLEKALTLAPDNAFIVDSMGWLEFRENRPEVALTLLQKAYQLRADPEIAIHIGEVLWSMGEQQKAKQFWKEALQKDPNNETLKSTLQRLKVQW